MEEEQGLDLVDQFLESFGGAIRAMRVIFRQEFEKSDVTWPQFGLMKMVKRHGTLTVTELSDFLRIAPPTASRMIDALCEKDMLERSRDAVDHRVMRVKLTPKSRRLLKKIISQQSEMMTEVFADEDSAELEAFTSRMNRLADRWLELAAKKTGAINPDE
jgi:DNA-binding MarR family transcriptional regulator